MYKRQAEENAAADKEKSCKAVKKHRLVFNPSYWKVDFSDCIDNTAVSYTHLCMITQVINVNEILKQALLFDFYGELLTDHQKEIYGQLLLEDLSLGEIARDAAVSYTHLDVYKRQAM